MITELKYVIEGLLYLFKYGLTKKMPLGMKFGNCQTECFIILKHRDQKIDPFYVVQEC